jgi:hypothetical protein
MSKHTPGPWRVTNNPDGVYHDTMSLVVTDKGEVCGPRQIRLQAPGDVEANARLIAAAPDLLAALKALLVMCHSPEPVKLDEALTWRENDERAEAMARAAIAKATADY